MLLRGHRGAHGPCGAVHAMTDPGIAHRTTAWLVCSALSLPVWASACKEDAQCYCPASGPAVVTVELACPSVAVQATGVCDAVQESDRQFVEVVSDAGGDCHVEMTFPGGSTSAVDFQFESVWLGCGSDPHRCGQGIKPTPESAKVGTPCEDAGADAGSVD